MFRSSGKAIYVDEMVKKILSMKQEKESVDEAAKIVN